MWLAPQLEAHERRLQLGRSALSLSNGQYWRCDNLEWPKSAIQPQRIISAGLNHSLPVACQPDG
jgi:hypothetical protein